MNFAELQKVAMKSLKSRHRISDRKIKQWLLESSPVFQIRVKELRAAILAKLFGVKSDAPPPRLR